MSFEEIGLKGLKKILDSNGRLECDLYRDREEVLGYKGESIDLQDEELTRCRLYVKKSDFGRFFGGREI